MPSKSSLASAVTLEVTCTVGTDGHMYARQRDRQAQLSIRSPNKTNNYEVRLGEKKYHKISSDITAVWLMGLDRWQT